MLKIFENEKDLAQEVFKEMKQQILTEDSPVFSLASGSTPKKIYSLFAKENNKDINFDKLKIVSLDEWIGVTEDTVGSCYQMLNDDLFKNIDLPKENIVFYKTVNSDLNKECERIDNFIKRNPITFTLMGVGMNGHIGLNEPNDIIRNYSSVVNLSEKTKEVAVKYFNEDVKIEEGITLGLEQIISAKRTIVIITGEHKKNIVKEIFENGNANLPAQVLLGHNHIDFYIDKAAGQLLENLKTKEVL
ncbi:MAG: 6-phosphogluconolactonase [Lachnospirales bacterium]